MSLTKKNVTPHGIVDSLIALHACMKFHTKSFATCWLLSSSLFTDPTVTLQRPKTAMAPTANEPFKTEEDAKNRAKVPLQPSTTTIDPPQPSAPDLPQELDGRAGHTAFDESETHEDARWEHFMQEVTDLTRLSRHHPGLLHLEKM